MPHQAGARRRSRDEIAVTALRLLDDLGLPDLTMRRLAAALDVQPGALYWHYRDKQSLLAELADRIVAGSSTHVRPAASRIHEEALALRDALLAHRDGAEVVSSTLALGLGSTTAHDRLAAAVIADGFGEELADRVATTMLHCVLGHVWHEQQRMHADSLGVVAASASLAPDRAADPTSDVAFAIDLLVGGIERARVASGDAATPAERL